MRKNSSQNLKLLVLRALAAMLLVGSPTLQAKELVLNVIGAANGPTDILSERLRSVLLVETSFAMRGGENVLPRDFDRAISQLADVKSDQLLFVGVKGDHVGVVDTRIQKPFLGIASSPYLIVSSRSLNVDSLKRDQLSIAAVSGMPSEYCATNLIGLVNSKLKIQNFVNTAQAVSALWKADVDLLCDLPVALNTSLSLKKAYPVVSLGKNELSGSPGTPSGKSIGLFLYEHYVVIPGKAVSSEDIRQLDLALKKVIPGFLQAHGRPRNLEPYAITEVSSNAPSRPLSGSADNQMEKAKSSCRTLGFKPGTESFGKCVLELIK